MYCHHCGNKIGVEESNFCNHCGSKIIHIEKIEEEKKETAEEIKNSYITEIETNSSIDSTQKESEFSPKVFIKIDKIDKWAGIKEGEYTNIELEEKRFTVSSTLLYVISSIMILAGLVVAFMGSDLSFYKIVSNTFVMTGISYLVLTFIFHKLRMPICLFLLALGMLIDKVYTMIFMTKHLSLLAFVIMSFLIIAGVEAFRSRGIIQNPKQKIWRIITISLFIIFGILVVLGLSEPYLFTKKWNKENSSEIEKLYYNSFASLKGYDGWKQYSDSMFNEIITKAAKCSILKTKEVYPTYDDFNKDYELLGKEKFLKKIQNIKNNCLAENNPNIVWDK